MKECNNNIYVDAKSVSFFYYSRGCASRVWKIKAKSEWGDSTGGLTVPTPTPEHLICTPQFHFIWRKCELNIGPLLVPFASSRSEVVLIKQRFYVGTLCTFVLEFTCYKEIVRPKTGKVCKILDKWKHLVSCLIFIPMTENYK